METKILKLKGDHGDIELIRKAAAIIESGGLVAFPTETVYGIACKADKEAVKHLDDVKGRGQGKRYSLHIGDKEQIERFVPKLSGRGAKLVKYGWPGPITIVFDIEPEEIDKKRLESGLLAADLLYVDNTIGIRCPSNDTAQKLLKMTVVPVVAPSANLSGKKPAASAQEVFQAFGGVIEAILESVDNECTYEKNSTVVKVSHGRVDVIREGVYDKDEVLAMSTLRITFVCTGNTCRSPMAEAFCRKYISEKLNCNIDEIEQLGYIVGSAGVMATRDTPASSEVVEICGERGVDVREHRSRFLTKQNIEESDYIFVMSHGHRSCVLELCPIAEDKCILLDSPDEISDPIGAGSAVYRNCAEQIEKAVKRQIDEILR